MIWNGEDMKQEHSDNPLQYSIYNNLLQLKRLKLIIEQVRCYSQQGHSNELTILEIGCGIGAISIPLSSLGHKVTGVDIDSKSISVCNESNQFPGAKYIVGDAEILDLQEKFDIVVCTEVMEHCPHPEKVAQTIKRHIAEGGIGIVSVPNGYCFSELVFSRLFQKIGVHSLFHRLPKNMYTALTGSPTPYYSANVACHHVQFFTFNKFSRLMSSSGFQILNVGNLDLGLILDWTWLSPLKQIECNIANFVPHFLSGGWVFVIKPRINDKINNQP